MGILLVSEGSLSLAWMEQLTSMRSASPSGRDRNGLLQLRIQLTPLLGVLRQAFLLGQVHAQPLPSNH